MARGAELKTPVEPEALADSTARNRLVPQASGDSEEYRVNAVFACNWGKNRVPCGPEFV